MGERAAGLPGSSDVAGHISLPEPSEPMDGVADADTRDRTEQGALLISKDPGAAEPRRLDAGKHLYRLYKEEGLALKKKPQLKRKALQHRDEKFGTPAPNRGGAWTSWLISYRMEGDSGR